jgi:protein involved in polysaccharide export with SLBB domain
MQVILQNPGSRQQVRLADAIHTADERIRTGTQAANVPLTYSTSQILFSWTLTPNIGLTVKQQRHCNAQLTGLLFSTITAVVLLSTCTYADAPAAAMGYVLGPDDQISIRIAQAPELTDKPVRIGPDGYIEVPFAGRLHAAGLTPEALRTELAKRFAATVHDPEVFVSVEDYRSQPVSVIGAVTTPGVHQIRGRKTLIEALSLAGGLRQDSGNVITITRRQEYGRIGIRGETEDGDFRTARVDAAALMDARDPQVNVAIQPNDVISDVGSRSVVAGGRAHADGGSEEGEAVARKHGGNGPDGNSPGHPQNRERKSPRPGTRSARHFIHTREHVQARERAGA